ncbi:hypothetical protein D3C80_1568270 [compost metagenome]
MIGQRPLVVFREELGTLRLGEEGIGLEDHVADVGHQDVPRPGALGHQGVEGRETGHDGMGRPGPGGDRTRRHALDVMVRQEGQHGRVLIHHQDQRSVPDRAQGPHEGGHVGDVIAGGVAQDQIARRPGRGRGDAPLPRDRVSDPAQID